MESHVHGHRQRLRDRFLKHGLEGFADYEVVELLLTLAIPRGDVKPTAKALIARFKNASPYAVERDKSNRMTFEPITTTALRLDVQFQNDWSADVLEWRVEETSEPFARSFPAARCNGERHPCIVLTGGLAYNIARWPAAGMHHGA